MKSQDKIKKLIRVILTILLSVHLVIIVMQGLIPSKSTIMKKLSPWIYDYTLMTGCKQNWPMFTTIPLYHSHHVELEVVDSNKNTFRLGPSIPGLKKYNHSYLRYHTTFSRMRTNTYKLYMNAYMENAKRMIEQEHNIKVRSLTMIFAYEKLQKLYVIRRKKEMVKSHEIQIGPYTWD